MARFILYILFFQSLTALSLGKDRGGGQPDLRRQLLVDAPQAQEQFRHHLVEGASFRYTHEFYRDDGSGMRLDGTSESHVCFSFPSMAVEVLQYSKKPDRGGFAKCVNDTYAFRIFKRSPNESWQVDDLGSDAKAFLTKGMYSGMRDLSSEELFLHMVIPVLDIEAIPLDRFFLDESVDVESIYRDDEGCVVIEFRGDLQTPTGYDRVLGGSIRLSPEYYWALNEYDLEVSSTVKDATASGRIRRLVEWSHVAGQPLPSLVAVETTGIPEINIPPTKREWRYDGWEQVRYPRERFLLSNYGLPEPGLALANANDDTRGGRVSMLVWMNIAGLFLIAVAVLLRWRSASAARQS